MNNLFPTSKREKMVYVFFFWVTLVRIVDKLDNTTYGLIVMALITTYLANRAITDTKAVSNDPTAGIK